MNDDTQERAVMHIRITAPPMITFLRARLYLNASCTLPPIFVAPFPKKGDSEACKTTALAVRFASRTVSLRCCAVSAGRGVRTTAPLCVSWFNQTEIMLV